MALPQVLFSLKCLQALPNGLGGIFLASDVAHGLARRDFVRKMGFPAWFPSMLGCYKLTQLAMNWVAGGVYVPAAQCLMAVQLGGAAYAHVVAEGAPLSSCAGVATFAVVTTTIQVLHGSMGLSTSVAAHTVLFGLGYATGYIVSFAGGQGGGGPSSPVKWRRIKGGL